MAQFRKLLAEKKPSGRFTWKSLGKAVISLFFLFLLWQALKRQEQSLADVWGATVHHVGTGNGAWLLIMVVLVPVNWALESWKWQLLVNRVQQISYCEAVVSTLSGLLSGLALPAQVGDVVGRVASLRVVDRSRTIGAALISGGIQFYAAVFAGLAGVYFLWERLPVSVSALRLITWVLWVLIAIASGLFIFRRLLFSRLPASGRWGALRNSLEVISLYENIELFGVFGVGALRYFTYLAQYLAGLLLFSFNLPVPELAACTAVILMIKTVMPALNLLGDLGLRGVSAVLVFGAFGLLPDEVIALTLLIWVTNILVPALCGIVLLWTRSDK